MPRRPKDTDRLILPEVLPRGVHHGLFYRDGAVPLIAIASCGECIAVSKASTESELDAVTVSLSRLLDDLDPLSSSDPLDSRGPQASCPSAELRLVK